MPKQIEICTWMFPSEPNVQKKERKKKKTVSGRTLGIASFHLKCTILLKCSNPFRAGIVSALCRQLQFGLILSLVILVKIALFSTG